jgi:hypothetical protein
MQKFVLSCLLLGTLPVMGADLALDFRDAAIDQTPANFQSVVAGTGQPGVWSIVSAPVPPLLAPLTDRASKVASRQVLAQTSQDKTDEHFPILVYEPENFRDFKLTTRFEIVSGVAEQMAGVVFRFQNASNFYVVRASALGHNVRFYKMVDGQRSDPIGPALDVPAGIWHTLAVQCAGTHITFWLDDLPGLALEDSTFPSGKIGFWTKSDAVSYFCDLAIHYTPIIPAAQTLVNSILREETRLLGLKIYVIDAQGQPHVIASKFAGDIGQPGGTAEKAAIADGTVSLGRGPEAVSVWLPLRDRNGDPMAAVLVRMKSFPGETQETAVTRATQVIKRMQGQVTTLEDLLK